MLLCCFFFRKIQKCFFSYPFIEVNIENTYLSRICFFSVFVDWQNIIIHWSSLLVHRIIVYQKFFFVNSYSVVGRYQPCTLCLNIFNFISLIQLIMLYTRRYGGKRTLEGVCLFVCCDYSRKDLISRMEHLTHEMCMVIGMKRFLVSS